MQHCAFSVTAGRFVRHVRPRWAHTSIPFALRHPTRTYTAIPLNRALSRRGGLPQLFHASDAAQPAASSCEASVAGSTTTTAAPQPQPQPQPQQLRFLQCHAMPRAPALAYPSPAATEEEEERGKVVRTRESMRLTSHVACVRIPRLLVFGGDVVSVTALEALHARMRCIVTEALRCSRRSSAGGEREHGCPASPLSSSRGGPSKVKQQEEEEMTEVDAFVREHITVVCPALPTGMTPEEAAKRFTRQYPVARYCVDHGLPIIPVDHPKSLARSTLLKEMLDTVSTPTTPGKTQSARPSHIAASVEPFSLDAERNTRTTPLTSHLSSHVFSAARLARSGASAATESGRGSRDTNSSTTLRGQATEAIKNKMVPHTWAAHGRPLDDFDLVVVVSFRYFLPQHLLRALPPVINMHPSLLPRYRGASPIFSALLRNEPVGGVSIIQMKPEQKAMDSGSILWQCEVPMTPDMDIRLYFPLVTQIGAAGLCDLIFGEAPATTTATTSTPSAHACASAFAARHPTTAAAVSAVTVAACVGAATALATHVVPPTASHTLLHNAVPLVSSTAAAAAVALHKWPKVSHEKTGTAAALGTVQHRAASLSEDEVVSDNGLQGSDVIYHDGSSAEEAQLTHGHDESRPLPPWVALRRRSLMPVVHGSAGRTRLPSLLGERQRLAPYMDRPELSVFSSIITTHSSQAESRKDDKGSSNSNKDKNSAVTSACESSNSGDAATGGCDSGCTMTRPCNHWMTLCRSSTHLTPEVIYEASKAHRALFFQNMESASAASGTKAGLNGDKRKRAPPHNKKQVSPAAAAELEISTSMKCAEVFPKSVLSPHCDWPDSFTYSWKFAQVQEYRTFAHFTDDPFHAPLLPKDAAVLRFSALTAMEAFGVWRAFVGGDYFQPSVNATLDKGGSPVRNQLVHRGLRRLLRERAKAQRGKIAASQQQQQQQRQSRKAYGEKGFASAVAAATIVATSEDNSTPVGIVVGKHVDLDVFSPAGMQLLTEAESMLRIPCTFTQVTNPTLVPQCVRDELAEVEGGGDRCCGVRPAAPLPGRHVRFYRAPPAIFRSLLTSRASGCTDTAEQQPQQDAEGEKQQRTRKICEDVSAAAATIPRQQKLHCGKTPLKTSARQQQPDEPAEDEEAPEDYVPDVIHAAPPTEHRWHIPPGTGYFPESDESYGAIKCKEGWFLWKEAHMKWANRAQPAVLIRKGLAMKTGVLYVGLFSEYS
jgi:hypothetical protein